MFTKVDTDGNVMEEHIIVNVRGYEVGVRSNTKAVLMEATIANIKWIVAAMQDDVAALSHAAAQQAQRVAASMAVPASDPEADPEDDQYREIIEELTKNRKYTGLW